MLKYKTKWVFRSYEYIEAKFYSSNNCYMLENLLERFLNVSKSSLRVTNLQNFVSSHGQANKKWIYICFFFTNFWNQIWIFLH